MSSKLNLIWIDLEMTGLDSQSDLILEIATIVTDKDLNILATGPEIAIHQNDEVLSRMNAWCKDQHAKSGLVERVKSSTQNEQEAELATLAFIKEYVPEKASPMCGNSICQDRRFLSRWMPTLEQYFHYRNLDVSTIKELARRWNREAYKGVKKESKHLALDDIKDSINELKHYRDNFIKLQEV